MMMVSRNGSNGLLAWLRENGYIVTFLVTQGAAIIIWGVRIDSRVDVLERSQHEQDIAVSRLDERGSRSIPLIEQRLKALEDAMKIQLDGIKEAQARIMQSLDSNNQLLNEHLRNPTGNDRSRSRP